MDYMQLRAYFSHLCFLPPSMGEILILVGSPRIGIHPFISGVETSNTYRLLATPHRLFRHRRPVFLSSLFHGGVFGPCVHLSLTFVVDTIRHLFSFSLPIYRIYPNVHLSGGRLLPGLSFAMARLYVGRIFP